MADLSITAANVRVVESPQNLRTRKAGAAVDAGAPVYVDTDGKVQEAQADGTAAERAVVGIAITSAAAANDNVSVAGPGSLVNVGNALSSVAFGATLYLSNTAGIIADSAGSVTVALGTVEPVEVLGSASAVYDKLIRVSNALPAVLS